MTRTNDIILRATTTLIAFIILGFSIYLFFAGHNAPGGGFIGGLMTSAAFVLMYMAYGIRSMEKILPINFRYIIPVGLIIALGTGIGSFIFWSAFF